MEQKPSGYRSQIMQIRSEIMTLYANLGKQPEADFLRLPVGDAAFNEDLYIKYRQKYNGLNEQWSAITKDLDELLMDLERDDGNRSELRETTHTNSDRASNGVSDTSPSDHNNVSRKQHLDRSSHETKDTKDHRMLQEWVLRYNRGETMVSTH